MKSNVSKSILSNSVGKNILITTDDWFFAPNGQQYKAVFGELIGVFSDEETLNIKTNDRSTNWYVVVGGMVIGGCQIHYAILTDTCDCEVKYNHEELIDGELVLVKASSRIWHAKQ